MIGLILYNARCLSDIMLNDTLLEQPHRLMDECRKQLRFERFQLNENIKLDDELVEACKEDVATLCGDVVGADGGGGGGGEILECLRAKQRDLTDTCKEKLLKRDRLNLLDPKSDFKLMKKCRNAIEQFCDAADEKADLIGCLRKQLMRPNIEYGCRQVL